MYALLGAPQVYYGQLPNGPAGTRATLELMRGLVHQGTRDMAVRDLAIRIVRGARVAPHDFLGELEAIYTWVRDRVRFTRDPYQVEGLQTARRTVQWRAGDCDDMSVLLASLLRSIGHPAQLAFRAIGVDRRRPGRFSHVFVVARHQGREVALDPTIPGTPMGWQFPRPTALREVAV